jgi:hypothetical protein
MAYVAHFTDGSTSPVEITGSYGRCDLIGVATRGDGKRRALFFGVTPLGPALHNADPWIARVEPAEIRALSAEDAGARAKGG